MMAEEVMDILMGVEHYVKDRDAAKVWRPGKDMVHYAGPYFDHREIQAAVETLLKGWLVMGNDCLRFETVFPRQFGRQHGILTNSGSSANLLMMKTLTSKRGHNFPPGTKVLTPVAGFPTTLNPILQSGFVPVFLDIELDTLNLDLTRAEELIREHDIKVITFAHVLGNPPNMDWVMDLVKRFDLVLLEDCCDALGSTFRDQPLGSFGEMASCSFYPAHHMTMGEGGFVVAKDKDTATILTSFREWGRGCYCVGPEANKLKCGTCKVRFSEWLPSLPGQIFDHKYVYDEIGYNLKPIELQGSMGLIQIEKLPEIHRRRRENYARLFKIYEKYEAYFHLPRAQRDSNPSWFAFPLTIRSGSPFTRTEFVDYLEDCKIQTRPYFAGNIMLQPAYTHLAEAENAIHRFPVATYATMNTLFHGTSPVITAEQIDYIGDCVDQFMKRYGA